MLPRSLILDIVGGTSRVQYAAVRGTKCSVFSDFPSRRMLAIGFAYFLLMT
jgi:hypothetical protein